MHSLKLHYYLKLLIVISSLLAIVLGVYGWFMYHRTKIVIEWTTVSELTTAGFNLYRSEEIQSNYRIINQSLIHVDSNTLIGNKYQYEDKTVTPRHRYYYILEEVNLEGKTKKQPPIQIIAKRGGQMELIISSICLLFAVLGYWLQLYWRRTPKMRE